MKTQNNEPKKIFILDCDATDTYNKMDTLKTNYLIPYIFTQNSGNMKIAKGIENLFNQSLFQDECYSTKTKDIEYGGKQTTFSLDKNKFASFVCATRNNPKDFENFHPLFTSLKELLI